MASRPNREPEVALARRRRARVLTGAALVLVAILAAVVVRREGGIANAVDHSGDLVRLAFAELRPFDSHGAGIVRERVRSEVLNRELEQIVVLPPGYEEADRRALVVLLHGRGDSPAGRLNTRLTQALAEIDAAPVVLLANGGDSSYYHDRDDGAWASYLRTELVPDTIERFGLDERRVAFAGISMGGFGALELVRQSGRRQCAVAAIAPALWTGAADTPAGAFDDAEDFTRHDVLGAVVKDAGALHETPAYLAAGDQDPFSATTATLATALAEGHAEVVHETGPGGHNRLYWDEQIPKALEWIADSCKESGGY